MHRGYLRFFPFFLALYAILSRVWVAEDAYITFRTVENLYAGYGLTFNPGERVEASTHPLWAIALIILRGIGIDLHSGSIALGLILSLSGIGILLFDRDRNGQNLFPLATLSLISISGFRDFATSGMEFSLLFFLLVIFYTLISERELASEPSLFASLLALMYLTRPEMALMVVWYSLFFALETIRKAIVRKSASPPRFSSWPEYLGGLLRWGFPILLIAGAYHLFRYTYYGELFPNTYYAKAGLSSYYGQGLKYLAYTVIWSPSVILLVLFISGTLLFSIRREGLSERNRGYLRDTGAALLLTLYVVRVGGDFMAFRFLLPEIAILALLAHRILKNDPMIPRLLVDRVSIFSPRFRSLIQRPTVLYLTMLLYSSFLFIPLPVSKGYVADERRHFIDPGASLFDLAFTSSHPWAKSGRRYGKLQRCLNYDDFWIANSQAYAKCMNGVGLGYFGVAAGPGVRILDEQGLPNREVAKSPVLLRFRPGHEHSLRLSEVLAKRALFCSTGEPGYDRIMKTNAGIVIHLEPDLLATIPDIHARLIALGELKRAGSNIIPRLERIYGVRVEDLAAQSNQWERDTLLRSKNRCWNEFPAKPEADFY
jgi:arabinofuranosyltransferase